MIRKLQALYELTLTRGFDRLRSPLILALRLLFGSQLMVNGWAKLHHIDQFVEFLGSLGVPLPDANARFVAGLECLGGALLVLGLAARLISIPLTINFVVAYLTADREAVMNVFSNPDAFASAAPFNYLVVSLLVLAFGPGAISIDGLLLHLRRGRSMTADAQSPEGTTAGPTPVSA